jgi:predicted RNA binding protein YcfA (HicA-like mRNA interferase family)
VPPVISRRELVRKFRALGYSGPFSGGKHQFMAKGRQKLRIPNPHGKGDIGVGLLMEILRQAGINDEEWNRA